MAAQAFESKSTTRGVAAVIIIVIVLLTIFIRIFTGV
jgi:hypothetical protein